MSFSSKPISSLVSLPPGPITFHPLPDARTFVSVNIANKTARAIAYKLKANNLDRYSARPNMGVLPVANAVDAGANSARIVLSVHALPSPPVDAGATCRDKFYLLVTPWLSSECNMQPDHERVSAFWSRTNEESVSLKELDIVLDMDAYYACLRSRNRREAGADNPATSSSTTHLSTGIEEDATRKDSVAGSGRVECIICMDSAAVKAFTPCGHHCVCSGCAEAILGDGDCDPTCPVCRARVEGCLRIYM